MPLGPPPGASGSCPRRGRSRSRRSRSARALDQPSGVGPLKRKCQSRVVVDGFPSGHAGEKGVHQDELRYLRRVLRRVGVGDHQTDVVPDDFRSSGRRARGEIVNACRGRLHVQAVGGNPRIADAGKIRRNHGEPFGEHRNDRAPHSGRLGVAVQQNQWRTLAGREVVQLHAADVLRERGDALAGLVRAGRLQSFEHPHQHEGRKSRFLSLRPYERTSSRVESS